MRQAATCGTGRDGSPPATCAGRSPPARLRPRPPCPGLYWGMRKRVFGVMVLCLGLAAAPASAGGRFCTTRDVIQFGNVVVGTQVTQNSTVTNCGDAPWTFTDVSIHPATAAAYHVTTSCATGQTMAPGASCTIDVRFAPVVPGQVSGGV